MKLKWISVEEALSQDKESKEIEYWWGLKNNDVIPICFIDHLGNGEYKVRLLGSIRVYGLGYIEACAYMSKPDLPVELID